MYIIESAVNRTRDHGIYFNEVVDVGEATTGKLYRDLMKEHGRCIGRMYRDGENGEALPIGWVFLKRDKYEDCSETYLKETWVELAKEVKRIPARLEVEPLYL